MIGAISEGARRIKEIIGELKNYSRRSGDPMGLLDINQVVHSSMLLLKHHINNCTENFLIELEEGLPLVSGNAQQLEQVIVNLVMNALQALDSKDQRVCLSSFHSKENRTVSLSVADNGCGMSDEVKARIMEPFFTTRLDAGGTGLGLSISRSIILAHHGSVEVESKAGQGTSRSKEGDELHE
jgi:signal transduction histidine kinase